MPLHSLQPLPGGVTLGLWHLTETPASLWPQLADAPAYEPLLPARADGPRQARWLAPAPGQAPRQLLNEASGRPFLVGAAPAPAVSVSHSGAWVAALLAPAGTAVGIDVEMVRDKAQRIARKFLNTEELATVEQLTTTASAFSHSPTELYSLLWSAKETLYKLANQRGIIFRQNLLLDLPASPWPAQGTLPARLQLAGCNSRHQICYLQPAAGYVLTYCYQLATS
jgi:4'-phosphopantetheinyl transferase